MKFKIRFIPFLIEIISFVIFLIILLNHTALLANPSKLYSTSIAHRLQTDALLHGHLSLSPRPFGYLMDYDWIGGHGLQQNWGLGVPLLRLPFEWTSVQLGAGPFPDRLILLFYLILTIAVLNITLRSVMKTFCVGLSSGIRFVIRWYFMAWIFFSQAMGGLIQKKINVYNETVLYGCLYVYVLICLLWIYIKRPNNRFYYILCLLSGLAWLIRPTLIFYGFPTFLIASIFSYKDKRSSRLIIMGIICFCIGVAIELWANYLRFGSMLDFGCPESGSVLVNYSARFDSTFSFYKIGILNVFKELLGDLFFLHPWQYHAVRLRNQMGNPFNIIHLIILVAGLILYGFFLAFHFLKQINFQRLIGVNFGLIYLSLVWGLITFGLLFSFYAIISVVSFRYLVEFSEALNVIFIALVLLTFSCLRIYFRRKESLISLFVFLGLFCCYANHKFFKFDQQSIKKRYQEQSTDKNGIKRRIREFNQGILQRPDLPERSYCGQSYSTAGLRYQYLGWDIYKDCSVSATTSAILPSEKCVTLNYTVRNIHEIPDVQVKRDLMYLKLIETNFNNIKGSSQVQMTQSFCSDAQITDSLALYSIGWVNRDQLNKVRGGIAPVKLNWLTVAQQSLNR